MIRVAAGIVQRGPRILAARRPEGKNRAGFWEFPGGRIEEGETPLDALRREFQEELNITVRDAELLCIHTHSYPDGDVCLYFFAVTGFTGEISGLEGQCLAWITPSEARALPFLEADLPLLEELAKTDEAC